MGSTGQIDWGECSRALVSALHLSVPPIAITFSDESPEGIDSFGGSPPKPSPDGRTGAVAAGCVFWIHATERTFTTTPPDHANCSVGSYTHGLITPEEALNGGDVATLLQSGWITPEAAEQIPQVPDRPRHVTYGPLGEATVDPQVVLLRVNGRQLMELSDALADLVIEGKPQCHIIARAYGGRPAASVGCALSRVRTGMSPTEMTAALPASRIDEIVDALQTTDDINDTVSRYAAADSQRFA